MLVSFSFLSIKDGKFKARYEAFTEATGDSRVITYENDAPVHPDLGEGMQRMTYHVVNLTGLMALDDDIHITGFQRQNCGDAQLLTIYARLEKDNMTCGNVAAVFTSAATNTLRSTSCLKTFLPANAKRWPTSKQASGWNTMPLFRSTTTIWKPLTLPPDEKDLHPQNGLPPGRPGGNLPDEADDGRKRFARLHVHQRRGIRLLLRTALPQMDRVPITATTPA